MKFTLAHTNINVRDLERSLAFYKKALGMEPVRRHKSSDGSFELAFLSDGDAAHQIELTWLRDKDGAYDLGSMSVFGRTTLTRPTPCIKKWAVYATRIPKWGYTSLRTPTDIGSR
jgi:catechol 2,3-dioxygenase-like lactoylglutathione lyase family enzyme